jgi:hypothetical protein
MTKKDKTVVKVKDRLASKARATGSRWLLRLRSILERSGEVEVAVEVEASVLEVKHCNHSFTATTHKITTTITTIRG